MTVKYQWSFLFSLFDILCVLNPAGQNVQQGLSIFAGLPAYVRHISRSLIRYVITGKWKRLSVDGPPASCPPCQYSCPIVLLTLISSVYISCTCMTQVNPWKSPKIMCFKLAALTYDLDIWTHLYVKRFDGERDNRQTDTTDRFYTLNPWRRLNVGCISWQCGQECNSRLHCR